MEEFGTLSMASVSPRCRATYMECLARMARSTGINLDGQNTAAEVDKALCLMLDQMFLEGEDLSKAQYMMAAMLFKWPQFQSPKQMLLPVSKQSLQGWRKLEPPRSRLPLPWEAVCLMAEHMMGHDMVEEALMMLLAFVMYLRPGEVCKLRCQDLVPPVGQGRREASKWSLVLHPEEELVPSKTAEFDETLLFDLPYTKFVAISVHQWRRTSSRPGHQLIFSKTASQLREAMVSVAQKCALQPLGDPHPYRSRHGGASRDFATGDRKQPDIQRRGRWKTAASTRRYEKGGRLGQLMRSLSQKVRDAAYKAAARIEKTAQCRR
jgi:integrase